jgi:sugar phosphate isomerase/epimerase
MKLAFSTLGCPDWDLQQVAEHAGEYGYDGVELRIKGDRHVDTAMSAAERKLAAESFRSRGVEIRSLSGYTIFTGKTGEEVEANLKQLQLNAELAYDLGAPLVRTFLGKVPEGMTFDFAVRQVAESLARAAEVVRPLGVSVVIETHDDFSASEAVERVLREAGNPDGIAVLWDTVHTYHSGETAQQVTERFGSLIRHAHFKDCVASEDNGRGHKYRYVLTGEGYIPIRENIQALRAIGYDGYLSFEWEKMWYPDLQGPEVALPQYLRYMRELLATV